MLEKFGKNFQRIVLGAIVLLLSAVFALQFGGPQAQGCTSNLRKTRYAAKAYGTTITEGEFRAAYTLAGFNRYPSDTARLERLKELTLDALIERTLLAKEARTLGFKVTDDDVMRRIVKDGTMLLSASVDAPEHFPSGAIPIPVYDDQKRFDKEGTKRFIQYHLRRSVEEFTVSQVDEMLAQRMRDLITSTVTVSESEAWNAYQWENEKVTVSYVRFAPLYFQERLVVNPAELTAWMNAHAQDINKAYEARKGQYTNLEKQVHARHILIKVDDSATDEQRAEAESKARAVLKRVRGHEDFAKVAREVSEDTGSARKGGDLGFNPKGRMVPEFDAVQFALKAPAISDLVKTQFGYHIIQVLGERSGNVPLEEAKKEIAENLYREEQAKARSKAEADWLAGELSQGKTLEELAPEISKRTGLSEKSDDAFAPKVQKAETFSRSDTPVSGAFNASAFVQTAFSLDSKHPFSQKPLQLGEDYFVLRLDNHAMPEKKEWETNKTRNIDRLLAERRKIVLKDHVENLKKQAREKDALQVNALVLSYEATADEES